MNCIIIEDQLPAQRILKKYIEDIGTLKLVGAFTDAIEAMILMKSQKIDLIFLDIHLPKISGIDFLKTQVNPPQVILTTAFPDYALESYEFDVVDYLLKPFSFQRFVKAVAKVKSNYDDTVLNNQNSETVDAQELYVKIGFDYVRILIDEITHIISDADYTELHTINKKHVSSETLKHWEELLPNTKFIRVHKSYIINTSKIEKVSGNQIFLSNHSIIPLGRAYKENFIKNIL
ncbi:LytTR family DNA-binding domain-containing protein [uncultured Aquimarina sp.]|uniref:LytR/AlgR family response regulator transcription factor n=1 Tax=uncultured Aquimarina sp. TaxID=575652 RepID=UPI00261F5C44|nr:LytTR family DNA-binding domain-containing protein [uncultured Aquimarina sp.]